MLEKSVEQALVNEVRNRGGRCLKWVSPGRRGVPDRICLFPGGVVVFVETKQPGKKIKDGSLQAYWQLELRKLGFAACGCSTTAEARVIAMDAEVESRRRQRQAGIPVDE